MERKIKENNKHPEGLKQQIAVKIQKKAKRQFIRLEENISQVINLCFSLLQSKLLDAGKLLGMLNALDDSVPVFDMAEVVLYSWVENIGQAMLPHEDVGEYSNAF